MNIRNAKIDDVKEIYSLLNRYSAAGLLLGRSLSSLYDHLRDFKVCEDDCGNGRIAGVCSLHVCWENLAEIRSLAVDDSCQGKKIGSSLVVACLGEVQTLGITEVFTLTYQPDFFKQLGFKHVDKNELPHKVWSDCIQCPKFPDCNEESMLWEFDTN